MTYIDHTPQPDNRTPAERALVAIKTLLSRDPCAHAHTAIAMIDEALKLVGGAPAAPCSPAQDGVCEALGCGCEARPAEDNNDDLTIAWMDGYSKGKAAAQPAPAQEPDCDRSACGDFSPGPCDNPSCPALRTTPPAAQPAAPLTELIDYILQDDIQNRLTPRVVDIAFSAFMAAKHGKNKDDGGPCDWFSDTKPVVMEALTKIRNDLSEAANNITVVSGDVRGCQWCGHHVQVELQWEEVVHKSEWVPV
jgi:hypothetical protein